MFAGLSLFYPDVVIGRPGARCDALEAQNMIVCIQEHGGVIKEPDSWISAIRSWYAICETALRWASLWLLRTLYLTLSSSHYPPRPTYLTLHTSRLFHTSSVGPYNLTHRALHLERGPVATNDCSGKHAVSSGTQSSGPVASRALGPCKW